MSYCAFQNTVATCKIAIAAIDEDDLSEKEQKARKRLIQLCADIADDCRHEIES